MHWSSIARHGARVGALCLIFGVAAAASAAADEAIAQPQSPATPSELLAGPDTKAMGFPNHWRPSVGVMLDWERRGTGSALGAELHGTLYKDLVNPATNVAGVSGEGYVRWVDDDTDGGARLFLSSPAAMLHFGLDYSIRDEQLDFVFSLTPAFRRSGLFGLGDNLRIDWYPSRDGSFMFGVGIPLERHMGKTRPRDKKVTLPKPNHASSAAEVALAPDVRASLEHVKHSAHWVQLYSAPFIDNELSAEPDKIAELKKAIADARNHFHQQSEVYPAGHTAPAEIDVYHRELERAFALAGAGSAAERVAAEARAILLDQVLLPYNRLLGQRKERDSLLGYGDAAEREFAAWLAADSGIAGEYHSALAKVFHEVIQILENCRSVTLERWTDSRLVWMALDLALRPEDHDTQAELDALLAKAVEEPFSDANKLLYIRSEFFQIELARSVHEARDYHVLWIHDYRGLNAVKNPDEVAFRQTVETYMQALIRQARDFDRTGRLASYFIFLDQMYFESNHGRLWLELLADPLHHEVHLPPGYEAWEGQIRSAQEDLRAAVAASTGLVAGKERYGEAWLRNRLRVQVNITNPADVSFRSDDFAKYVNFTPDLVMRDHRKIAFWDVTELDPGSGGAIFSGAGIGEHYVGPTWDDRALLLHGPAICGLKRAARELLRSQGFDADEIPEPFQPLDQPADYESKVAALRAEGWQTKALQVHNVTGFGPKRATVAKAAQYNLMPAGSVLFIPDSLWNSTLWGSMLFGAALRGCKVAVICPSLTNAPSDGLPQMSRTTELFTRLLVLSQEFGQEVEAAGGSFHAGIYNHDVAAGDHARSLRVLSERLPTNPFLREGFPFQDDVLASFAALADTLEARGYSARYLAVDAFERKPKLHLKVQFMATRDVIPTLASRPEWGELVRDWILTYAKEVQTHGAEVDARAIQDAARQESRVLIEKWWNSLSEDQRQHMALYMNIGSHNQNYRSLIMDGEVTAVVSGVSALVAYIDFARVMGLSTWVTTVEELEKLLPKPTGIGRWMRNAI